MADTKQKEKDRTLQTGGQRNRPSSAGVVMDYDISVKKGG